MQTDDLSDSCMYEEYDSDECDFYEVYDESEAAKKHHELNVSVIELHIEQQKILQNQEHILKAMAEKDSKLKADSTISKEAKIGNGGVT